MTNTPALALDNTTAPVQMYRVLDGVFLALGNTIPGATAFSYNSAERVAQNCALNSLGLVWALCRNGIYTSRDDCETWETSLVINSNDTPAGGLFEVWVASKHYICAAFNNGATGQDAVAVYDVSAGTWTTYNSGNSASAYFGVMAYGDRLAVFTNWDLDLFDPSTGTFTAVAGYSFFGAGAQQVALAEFRGSLWVIDGSSGTAREIAGGVQQRSISYTGTTSSFQEAFVDPATDSLIIMQLSTDTVWYCIQIEYSGTVTDRTAAVTTPTALVSTFRAKGIWIDQDEAGVDSSPEIYLLVPAGGVQGSPVQMWLWNDVTTPLGSTPVPSGGNNGSSYPHQNYGSERFFSPRSPGSDGVPIFSLADRGPTSVDRAVRNFRGSFPRSRVLATGDGGSLDLTGVTVLPVPIQPGTVTIRGTLNGGGDLIAVDDGVGGLSGSLFGGVGSGVGSINYATGALTGSTDALDNLSDVEFLFCGGTATVGIYRTVRTDDYVVDSAPSRAGLYSPQSGSIQGGGGGTTWENFPCDSEEVQVQVDMQGYNPGARPHFQGVIS